MKGNKSMKLMTTEIGDKLRQFGYLPDIDNWMDADVIVKYFNPCGAGTWLIVSGEERDGDWILFGYVTLGAEWEWGPVSLSDLEKYKGPFGLGIERDLYCGEQKVRDLSN